MSPLLMKNNQNKKSSSFSTISATTKTTSSTADVTIRTRDTTLHKHRTIKTTTTIARTMLSPSVEATTSNVIGASSSSVSEISLFSMAEQQPIELTQITSASLGSGRKVSRTMPSFKIMSYQNIIALLTVLVCGLVTVNGLKCYMCGQYNEGVGSITPCLNYSEQYAHLYLKECSKKSEKYCVKYVSELSIVRDCATECAEKGPVYKEYKRYPIVFDTMAGHISAPFICGTVKEIWETQTYCCTEDGCNDSSAIEVSAVVVILPLVTYIVNEIMNIMRQQRR